MIGLMKNNKKGLIYFLWIVWTLVNGLPLAYLKFDLFFYFFKNGIIDTTCMEGWGES